MKLQLGRRQRRLALMSKRLGVEGNPPRDEPVRAKRQRRSTKLTAFDFCGREAADGAHGSRESSAFQRDGQRGSYGPTNAYMYVSSAEGLRIRGAMSRKSMWVAVVSVLLCISNVASAHEAAPPRPEAARLPMEQATKTPVSPRAIQFLKDLRRATRANVQVRQVSRETGGQQEWQDHERAYSRAVVTHGVVTEALAKARAGQLDAPGGVAKYVADRIPQGGDFYARTTEQSVGVELGRIIAMKPPAGVPRLVKHPKRAARAVEAVAKQLPPDARGEHR